MDRVSYIKGCQELQADHPHVLDVRPDLSQLVWSSSSVPLGGNWQEQPPTVS